MRLPMSKKIKAKVESIGEVRDCHAVRVRHSGPHYFVDLHITLDGRLPLHLAHAVTDRLNGRVMRLFMTPLLRALKTILGEDQVSEIERQVEAGKLSLADLDSLAEKGKDISTGILTLIFGSANPQEVAFAFLHSDQYDEEISKIHHCHGVIGLIADNYWVFGEEEKPFQDNPGIPKLIETIDYIHNITGTYENIAIGTDYDGFTDTSDDLRDPSQMPNLTQALLDHINDPAQVKLILGGNALRVLREGWI
jgi:hypothetical protein